MIWAVVRQLRVRYETKTRLGHLSAPGLAHTRGAVLRYAWCGTAIREVRYAVLRYAGAGTEVRGHTAIRAQATSTGHVPPAGPPPLPVSLSSLPPLLRADQHTLRTDLRTRSTDQQDESYRLAVRVGASGTDSRRARAGRLYCARPSAALPQAASALRPVTLPSRTNLLRHQY